MRQTVLLPDSPSLRERFWKKVDLSGGPDACWLWTGSRDGNDYGRIGVQVARGKSFPYLAHRASYEFAHGAIPADLFVCHSCDTPPCVNPAHLFLGTNRENQIDLYTKGYRLVRSRDWGGRRSGSQNNAAKLTEAQVEEIRVAYASGGTLQRELAARYGVSQQLISGVVKGERWGHLKQP